MNKNTTNDSFSIPTEAVPAQAADANGSSRGSSSHDVNGLHHADNFGGAGQPVLGEGVFSGGGSYGRFDTGASSTGFGADPRSSARFQEDDETFDWQGLAATFRRRWKLIQAVFLSVVALGLVLTYLTRPIYGSASTLLFTDPSSNLSLSAATDALPMMGSSSKSSSRATQLEILQGPLTVGGAMERLALKNPGAIKTLQSYYTVSADPIGETDIISVSVQTYDPQIAADLANALCEQYIDQNKNRSRKQATAATEYLRDRLRVVRADLDAKRLAFKRFQVANNTVDPTEEAKTRIAQYGDIQTNIRALQADRASDIAELSAVRSMIAKTAPVQVRPTGIARRPVVTDLQSSLTALQLERLKTAQEYAEGSDPLKQLDTQIGDIKARLAKEAQTEVVGWSPVPNAVRENGLLQAAALQAKVWAQESRAKALNEAAKVAEARMKQLPDQQYRLGQLTTDLQTLQTTYQFLNEKYIGMRLQEQTSLSNAQILTRASAMTVPVSPKKKTNFLLSVLLGLVLAITTGVIADHLDDRVHSQQEAEQASGLSILTQVPYIKNRKRQALLATGGETSILLESYRMLRTNIEFASLGKALRSITLTSTQPSEGKSTTSADLGVVTAMDGRKVILLDADLRRPSLHTIFDLPNRIGFTNLIAGTATLEEALQPTPIPNLFLLSSGPIPPNPPELLNSKAARSVISRMGEECDLLLIDTPPALVMADAQIVASMTDAAILVVSVQEAGKREIARTSQSLTHTGTNILGVVLNKATPNALGYGSYRGYQKRYYGDYVKK